jgi:hypothetical protein
VAAAPCRGARRRPVRRPRGAGIRRRGELSTDQAVWRVGHRRAPLDFVPRHLCGWQHRWDDPEREYRTLYAAESELTCLREVLADLRPNAKAIAELTQLFGDTTPALRDAGVVGHELLDAHLLCPARAVGDGDLCDLDADVELRNRLEREHAQLLVDHDMDHLDISHVRSNDRIVTQTIGRALYARDYAGVAFGSNLDDLRCTAIFEGRAVLLPNGQSIELAPDLPQLVQVCDELGLTIR